MTAAKGRVVQALERARLTASTAVQVMGGEVVVEGDCQRLGGFQRLLEAEGIASTLDLVEEEASWATHLTRRAPSNCVMVYSLRIPVS